MGARAARSGVMLRRFDTLTNLTRQVLEAERRRHSDPEYCAELFRWRGHYGSTADVPERGAPLFQPAAATPTPSVAG